jgi:hypothetical protein
MPATPAGLAKLSLLLRLSRLRSRWGDLARQHLSRPRERNFVIIISALLALAFVLLVGSGEGPPSAQEHPRRATPTNRLPPPELAPEPEPEPVVEPAPEPALPPGPPPAVRPPPRDPWATTPNVAPELVAAVAQVDAGQAEEAEAVTKTYVKEHRTDPLGHLALGHGYCARGWRRDCLLRYRIALRLDDSVRGDPRMLAAVVTAMGDPRVTDDAAEMVRVTFGTDAVPVLVEATTASRTVEGGRAAARVLAELGEDARVDTVAVALADLTRARRCEDRTAALEVLRTSDDARIRPALEALRTNLDVMTCLGESLERVIASSR